MRQVQLNGIMYSSFVGSVAPPSMKRNMNPQTNEAVEMMVEYTIIWNWRSICDSHHLVKNPFRLAPARAILSYWRQAHLISAFRRDV